MVATDIFLRALPWSEIILSRGRIADDLNTSVINRLGVALAIATIAIATLATIIPAFRALAGLLFIATLLADIHVLKQFWKERGPVFTIGVVPLHFVHRLCSGAGFAIALKQHYLDAKLEKTIFTASSEANDLPALQKSIYPSQRRGKLRIVNCSTAEGGLCGVSRSFACPSL